MLTNWQAKQPLSATHLNEVVDTVKELMAKHGELFSDYATYTPVLVKITSSASGGGKYNGRILDGLNTAAATGNLAMPEGMTVPTADDCLILNLSENAASTHTIADNSWSPGLLVGQTAAGLRVVALADRVGASSTYSGSITNVSAVTYNTGTHVLAYTYQTITVTNGLITAVSGDSTTTVDTAVSCS